MGWVEVQPAASLQSRAMPDPIVPRLLLAPMEGMVDHLMREVLTEAAPYDHAVTEFARVTGTVLPPRFYLRISPELLRNGRTPAGVPVRVQLLGSDPDLMAANAEVLSALRPPGVDLNFGCPARTVNRHRGGAVLLDEPETLFAIARAVRAAVPGHVPVTAKMRLGVRDPSRAVDCARALAEAGIAELVVHARTKAQGYRPPAHWAAIARLAEAVEIPVVANGEVWTVADWQRCRAESGCADVMLGRGAVADPYLVERIRAAASGTPPAHPEADWRRLAPGLARYWIGVRAKVAPCHAAGRLKQWVGLLARCYPQAEVLRQALRPLTRVPDVEGLLVTFGVIDPSSKAA